MKKPLTINVSLFPVRTVEKSPRTCLFRGVRRQRGRLRRPQRSRNAALGALFPGGRERRRGAGLGAAPAGGRGPSAAPAPSEGGREGRRMNLERLRKRVRHYIDQVSARRGLLGKGREAHGFSSRKNRTRRGSRREGGRAGVGRGAVPASAPRRRSNFILVPRSPWKARRERRAGSAACVSLAGAGSSRWVFLVSPSCGEGGGEPPWGRRAAKAFAGSRPLGLCKLGRTYLRQGERASVAPGQVQVGYQKKKSLR